MHRCRPLVYIHAYIVCLYLCRCLYMCMYACSHACELRVRRWRKIWRRVKHVCHIHYQPNHSQRHYIGKKCCWRFHWLPNQCTTRIWKKGEGWGIVNREQQGDGKDEGYRHIVINASHRWSIGDWTKSKFASCPCQLPYKTPLLGVPWVTLPIKSRPYH